MIRGDTANFKFTVNMQNIKGKSEPWIPTENDRVYFTCKKDFDSEVAFQKVYPETISYGTETNYFHTTVEPKDTCRLKAGDYLYEIKIVKNAINPTINFKPGDFASLPLIEIDNKNAINYIVESLIKLAKIDMQPLRDLNDNRTEFV